MSSRRSCACFWCCLVVVAVVSAICVSSPALYWKFNKDMKLAVASPSCAPCICDCPPPLYLLKIAPGLANLSVVDCGGKDPEAKEEMGKQFWEMLNEELKLQEAVREEQGRQMNISLVEARRGAKLYQKEAEKCNVATEMCEQAREWSEALLTKEKRITSLWERRTRQLGWVGE